MVASITLTPYSSGRTRFRMIEFDEEQNDNTAYKFCMNECRRHLCQQKPGCSNPHSDDALSNECMGSEGSDPPDWPGFQLNDQVLVKKCGDINTPAKQADEPKPNLSFKPYEIWQLFEQ